MVKATKKDSTKSTSAPVSAIGAPSSVQPHELKADDLEVGLARPGDSLAQAKTRQFLRNLMRSSPRPEGKTKSDWRRECRERFGIPTRSFDRIWDEVIDFTNAVAYRRSGPRGPHRSPRRDNS
jgi:hypothetical protein